MIYTHTNRLVNPLNLRPLDIDIIDIAHALSHLCRFTGHTRQFYSVAQHSVELSYHVDPDNARWALLHDAAEAYLGDVATPIKECLPIYRQWEDNALAIIARSFSLPDEMPEQVKTLDLRLTRREGFVLVDDRLRSDLHISLQPFTPEAARAAFLKRYDELHPLRGERDAWLSLAADWRTYDCDWLGNRAGDLGICEGIDRYLRHRWVDYAVARRMRARAASEPSHYSDGYKWPLTEAGAQSRHEFCLRCASEC